MKKTLMTYFDGFALMSAFFLLVAILLLCPGRAMAAEYSYSGSWGDNISWSYDGPKNTLTFTGSGPMKEIARDENGDFAEWPDWWYVVYEDDYLDSVVFSDGITGIAESTLRNLTVDEITLPAGLTTLRTNDLCVYYANVVYLGKNTSLEENCLNGVEFAVGPENLDYEGSGAYYANPVIKNGFLFTDEACTNLTGATHTADGCKIPSTTKTIEEDAFGYLPYFKEITVPATVEEVGNNAFGYCYNVIYKGALDTTDWNPYAINGYYEDDTLYENAKKETLVLCLKSDTDFVIPNSVKKISRNHAFLYNMDTVTVPAGIKTVSEYAFDSVYNIVYSGGLDTSYWGARYYNLIVDGDFLYEDAKKTILNRYKGKDAVLNIPEGVTTIGGYVIKNYGWVKRVLLPESVTTIGDYAFAMTYINEVRCPQRLEYIGKGAFDACENLVILDLHEVGTVASYAFTRSGIEYLYIEKLDEVNEYSFSAMHQLKMLTILDGSFELGEKAIPYCENLTTLSLPAGAVIVGDGVAYGCTDLRTIYYGGSKEQWDAMLAEYSSNENLAGASLVANHKHEIIPGTIATPPDCVNHGEWGGNFCETCNTLLIACYTSDRYGHAMTQVSGKAATTSANGYTAYEICSRCGKTVGRTSIYKVSDVKLSSSSYTYDGKTKKPTVTVKDSKGKKLVKNTDYTVSYASGCKSVGKYAVKIKFKGNYSGSKTLYFTINPKGTSMATVTGVKGGFRASWKKLTTQTTGYQLQYATSSGFASAKTVTISKNTTTTKTVTKLKKGKKYYVRIRCYKTVSGTKYYSAWSSYKTVTEK